MGPFNFFVQVPLDNHYGGHILSHCIIFVITGASVPTLPDFVPPELGLNRQCGIDLNLTLSGVKEGKEWALKSIYLFYKSK